MSQNPNSLRRVLVDTAATLESAANVIEDMEAVNYDQPSFRDARSLLVQTKNAVGQLLNVTQQLLRQPDNDAQRIEHSRLIELLGTYDNAATKLVN